MFRQELTQFILRISFGFVSGPSRAFGPFWEIGIRPFDYFGCEYRRIAIVEAVVALNGQHEMFVKHFVDPRD
jgi:hypothetical protein